MLLIFVCSSQAKETSYSLSGAVTKFIRNMGVNDMMPSVFAPGLEHYLRKLVHISLFFCLGITSCIFFTRLLNKVKKYRIFISGAVAGVFCFLCACLDEWHQSFVPGRTGCIRDVRYDAMGFLIGIVLVMVVNGIRVENVGYPREGKVVDIRRHVGK